MAALKGQSNLLAYSTTKGGVVDTPILGDMTEEMKATYADAHLIKRLATADEVASLFEFLIGPNASFITGHTYPLDGGASIS